MSFSSTPSSPVSRAAILIFDRQTRVVSWTAGLEQLSRLESSEVVGKLLEEIDPSLAKFARLALKDQSGREPFELASDLMAESPNAIVTAIEWAPLPGVGGWLHFSYAKTHQAPPRELRLDKNEASVAASPEIERARLFRVLDVMPAAIAIASGEGHVVEYANQNYCRDAGKPASEIIGKRLVDAHPELRSTEIMELTGRVFRTGEPFSGTQSIDFPGPNGEVIPKHRWGLMLPLHDQSGAIDAILAYSFDVTEQTEARHKVEQSEARLRFALECSNMGLWEYDLTRGTSWRSGPYAALFGYEAIPSTWTMDSFVTHIRPEDRERCRKQIAQTLSDPTVDEFLEEWPIVRADGRLAWLQDRGRILRSADGRPSRVIGAVLDVTEAKEAEEKMRAMMQAADDANRAKTAFVANMSHEFRTPLTAILGFAEFVDRSDLSLERREATAQGLRRNGHALLKLVDDLLDLSKVESGTITIEPQAFSPRSLLRDVIELFGGEAAKKGITLHTSGDESLPDRLVTDPIRLRQILLNLVGNAIKFTERGTVVVRATLRENPKLELIMDVEDTGLGLDANQVQELFLPFSQAHRASGRNFAGTGLGLYISRRIARALDGDVLLIRSESGTGSVFRASVGVSTSDGLPSIDSAEMESISGNLVGFSILVVEDTTDVRQLLRAQLEAAGAEVKEAADGLEAVALASTNPFDAILMDLQMPKMDGYLATETLRKKGINCPILAFTALAQPEDRTRCFELGFDAYLNKPLRLKELLSTLKRVTRLSRSLR